MSEEASETGGPRISRRKFLEMLGLGTAALMVNGCQVLRVQQNVSPSATPVSMRLPNAEFPDVQLKPTAVALEKAGLTSSFQEKNGFTKEMFERVRSGTVLLTVIGDKKTGNGVKGKEGTGYVIKREGNSIYIVTNKHNFLDLGNVIGLNIWRPNLDTKKYQPAKFTVSMMPGDSLDLDIAMIKAEGDYASIFPDGTNEFVEKQNLQDKNVLVVGFPGIFREGRDDLSAFVLGSVMKVDGKVSGLQESWVATGLSSPGSSGSPVFALNNNALQLVGLVNSIGFHDVEVKPGVIQKTWDTIIRGLEVVPLLSAVK